MLQALSVFRICVADCFESRVGVVIVRVQFIWTSSVVVLGGDMSGVSGMIGGCIAS